MEPSSNSMGLSDQRIQSLGTIVFSIPHNICSSGSSMALRVSSCCPVVYLKESSRWNRSILLIEKGVVSTIAREDGSNYCSLQPHWHMQSPTTKRKEVHIRLPSWST